MKISYITVRCQITITIFLYLSTAFWSSLTRSFCWDNFHLWRGWTETGLHVTAFSFLWSCGWQRYLIALSHSRIPQFLFFGVFYERGQGLGHPKATLQPTNCESVMTRECVKMACVFRHLWILRNEDICQGYSGRVCSLSICWLNVRETECVSRSGITFSG